MIAEMPERKLHNVVTEWKDGRHFMTTSRVHIFVWMLSGFDMANLKDLLVNEDFVEMILKVQDTTLNKATKKVFDHRMFDQDYFVQEDGQPPQPVASAIAGAINGLKNLTTKEMCIIRLESHFQRGGNGTSHRAK